MHKGRCDGELQLHTMQKHSGERSMPNGPSVFCTLEHVRRQVWQATCNRRLSAKDKADASKPSGTVRAYMSVACGCSGMWRCAATARKVAGEWLLAQCRSEPGQQRHCELCMTLRRDMGELTTAAICERAPFETDVGDSQACPRSVVGTGPSGSSGERHAPLACASSMHVDHDC